jgi:hypothetical protein
MGMEQVHADLVDLIDRTLEAADNLADNLGDTEDEQERREINLEIKHLIEVVIRTNTYFSLKTGEELGIMFSHYSYMSEWYCSVYSRLDEEGNVCGTEAGN